jgi:hypothetical protein
VLALELLAARRPRLVREVLYGILNALPGSLLRDFGDGLLGALLIGESVARSVSPGSHFCRLGGPLERDDLVGLVSHNSVGGLSVYAILVLL